MPSHIENSPNNLCEAMLIGMPCISTFAGGAGSLITDKFDGILIQDGDPYAMAGAILELYNDKEKAILLGQNARETALKRHDKDTVINDIIYNYNKIINDSKGE
jgi:glycosyltransferase involved in cell wall biosynthesis